MKNRRSFILAAVMVGMIAGVTGCGSSSISHSSTTQTELTVDTAALASELAENTVTSDTLTETASSMLTTIYNLSDDALAGGTAYMSAGSTACEVAVLECTDGQTSTVVEQLESRVKSQSDLYSSYDAEEVAKLDEAIVKSSGKYAVLVVCDDVDQANEILSNYGF